MHRADPTAITVRARHAETAGVENGDIFACLAKIVSHRESDDAAAHNRDTVLPAHLSASCLLATAMLLANFLFPNYALRIER